MFNNTNVIPKKMQIWFTIISVMAIIIIAITVNILAAGALFILNAVNTMALAYLAQSKGMSQPAYVCKHVTMDEPRMREYVDRMEKRMNDSISANAKAIQDLVKSKPQHSLASKYNKKKSKKR